MRAAEETKKSKNGGPPTRSAAVGPSVPVYGFNDNDDLENQAAYTAWGGRSAWRGLGRGQAVTSREVEATADGDADDDLDQYSGVDSIETHMSVFTFLKIVSESACGSVAGMRRVHVIYIYIYVDRNRWGILHILDLVYIVST